MQRAGGEEIVSELRCKQRENGIGVGAMNTHRVETTFVKDGVLTLDGLPFHAGDSVEVIILPRPSRKGIVDRYPLHGTSLIYECPTEPVAIDDWETLK